MRTTVEISDTQRARLLELAARRGEKGFSGLVREALTQYLDAEGAREAQLQAALEAMGSLSATQANRLEREVASLRASWR